MNPRAPFIRAPKRLETKADFAVFISDMADSAMVLVTAQCVSEHLHLHLGSRFPASCPCFFLRATEL